MRVWVEPRGGRKQICSLCLSWDIHLLLPGFPDFQLDQHSNSWPLGSQAFGLSKIREPTPITNKQINILLNLFLWRTLTNTRFSYQSFHNKFNHFFIILFLSYRLSLNNLSHKHCDPSKHGFEVTVSSFYCHPWLE